MAVIQNERDKILQAANPRVIPIPIPIGEIEGLEDKLEEIDENLDFVGREIVHVMNNTRDIAIRVSSLNVTATGSVTLELIRKTSVSGDAEWSVYAGTAELVGTGDTRTISGSTVSSLSVTVKAKVGTKEAYATINKLGVLSTQDVVNLSSQVTNQLAIGNVTGYGALALLNTVNLNTQTTGALNGQTQVTNLGALAYANAIAANQIGAGQLAAGVIYAGSINVNQLTGADIYGKNIVSGEKIILQGTNENAPIYMYSSGIVTRVSMHGGVTLTNGISPSPVDNLSGGLYLSTDGATLQGNLRLYATPGSPVITVDGNGFDGNLGSRILLKGVDYTATFGTETKTFRIN